MPDEVILALIGVAGVIGGAIFTHTIPKLLESAKGNRGNVKDEAEADATKWQTLVNEIGRLEKKLEAHEQRIATLEDDLSTAQAHAKAYHDTLLAHNITPPEPKRTPFGLFFPVPGVR